eukprot:1185127-Prorocentrum_minimum.AAC.1
MRVSTEQLTASTFASPTRCSAAHRSCPTHPHRPSVLPEKYLRSDNPAGNADSRKSRVPVHNWSTAAAAAVPLLYCATVRFHCTALSRTFSRAPSAAPSIARSCRSPLYRYCIVTLSCTVPPYCTVAHLFEGAERGRVHRPQRLPVATVARQLAILPLECPPRHRQRVRQRRQVAAAANPPPPSGEFTPSSGEFTPSERETAAPAFSFPFLFLGVPADSWKGFRVVAPAHLSDRFPLELTPASFAGCRPCAPLGEIPAGAHRCRLSSRPPSPPSPILRKRPEEPSGWAWGVRQVPEALPGTLVVPGTPSMARVAGRIERAQSELTK